MLRRPFGIIGLCVVALISLGARSRTSQPSNSSPRITSSDLPHPGPAHRTYAMSRTTTAPAAKSQVPATRPIGSVAEIKAQGVSMHELRAQAATRPAQKGTCTPKIVLPPDTTTRPAVR